MATTIAFKVEVDGGQSIKELSAIEKELEGINEKVESGTLGFRESTKAIKEYQDIAVKAGRDSPVGQEAIRKAAILKDNLGDLRNEITRLSQDGQAMQGALALGETVVAGYGAFQGVIALVGNENEKLLQTIAKLQAAQSILTGIERIRLALEKESVLMLQARVLWTKAQSAATALYTTATTGATAATRALNIALSAGILGAIIAGVAALAMNWDKVTKALGLSKTESQKATEAYLKNSDERIAKINEEIAAQQKSYDLTIARLKVENKDATEAITARSKVAEESYKAEMKLIQDAIAERQRLMVGMQETNSTYIKHAETIKTLQGTLAEYQGELDKIELARRENIKKAVDAIDTTRSEPKRV
jgi:hypothetical protein